MTAHLDRGINALTRPMTGISGHLPWVTDSDRQVVRKQLAIGRGISCTSSQSRNGIARSFRDLECSLAHERGWRERGVSRVS